LGFFGNKAVVPIATPLFLLCVEEKARIGVISRLHRALAKPAVFAHALLAAKFALAEVLRWSKLHPPSVEASLSPVVLNQFHPD